MMKMIKWAIEIEEKNLDEACEYIKKAYCLKDDNRVAADWCREMASAHLNFNSNGDNLLKRLIDDVNNGNMGDFDNGVLSVWMDRHADLASKTAEIKAMIDSYK